MDSLSAAPNLDQITKAELHFLREWAAQKNVSVSSKEVQELVKILNVDFPKQLEKIKCGWDLLRNLPAVGEAEDIEYCLERLFGSYTELDLELLRLHICNVVTINMNHRLVE